MNYSAVEKYLLVLAGLIFSIGFTIYGILKGLLW